MKRKAIIISIKSFKLSNKEKKLFSHKKPWGLILFKRNIQSLNQIKNLITVVRKVTKDPKFPIMIDEEGKTVSRLSEIINNDFSQKFFGDLYRVNPKNSLFLYRIYINNLSNILKNIGININTVPVLDVLRKNTNKIIGIRSFSNRVHIVKKLGNFCVNEYSSNKIGTIIKHIPGHGCASLDSHLKLPRVKLTYKNLI